MTAAEFAKNTMLSLVDRPTPELLTKINVYFGSPESRPAETGRHLSSPGKRKRTVSAGRWAVCIFILIAISLAFAIVMTQEKFDPMVSATDDVIAAKVCTDNGYDYFQRLSSAEVYCNNDPADHGSTNAVRLLKGK